MNTLVEDALATVCAAAGCLMVLKGTRSEVNTTKRMDWVLVGAIQLTAVTQSHFIAVRQVGRKVGLLQFNTMEWMV